MQMTEKDILSNIKSFRNSHLFKYKYSEITGEELIRKLKRYVDILAYGQSYYQK